MPETLKIIKKILIVNGEFPPMAGGGGIYTYNLAFGLASAYPNLDIVVLTGTSDTTEAKIEEKILSNLTILRYRDLYLIDEGQTHIWNIVQILNDVISSYMPDIVHTHHIYESFSGILCKQILKFPLVVSIQKSPVAEFVDWKNDPQWSLVRFIFDKGNYDHVISNSSAYENMAKFFGCKSDISKIYYGIKKDNYFFDKKIRRQARLDLKIRSGDFVVFCPSRIDERKGIDILLSSLSKIREISSKNFKKIIVLIAGNSFNSGVDGYKIFIKRLIRNLKLDKKVKILGRDATQYKMNNYYNASDLVVIPSNREGLGLVAIEAMRTKRPILASNTVGLNEIIIPNINGNLFTRDDSSDLAKKILKILKNYSAQIKIAENAYLYQSDKFNIKKMVQEHFNVYKKVFLKFNQI